jgi:uncharacterized protein YkwD
LAAVPALVWAALATPAGAAYAAANAAPFAGPVAAAAAHKPKRSSHPRKPTRSCSPSSRKQSGRGSSRKSTCRTSTRHSTPSRPQRSRSGADTSSVTTSASAAAAAQASVIAQVLATPCQNTQLIPEPSNLATVRASVLCLINLERAEHGEEPLQPNRHLEAAAEGHGKEMLAVDYFDHVSPSGVTPVDRIRQTGYIPSSEVGYVIGENLAWGTLTLATPEAIVNAWIASPEHLANILEGKYRDTGIDIEPEVPQELAEGVEGALYTQEFGVIVH